MRLETGTWVLVIDGEKALLLENVAEGANPTLRQVVKEAMDPAEDDPRGQRSAIQGAAEGLDESPEFLAEIAARLYRDAHRGRFDRLVLVAGPEALGMLRPRLHAEVQARVVAEVHKTLTRHPLEQIERLVSEELARL